jgi:hypothetical protein
MGGRGAGVHDSLPDTALTPDAFTIHCLTPDAHAVMIAVTVVRYATSS